MPKPYLVERNRGPTGTRARTAARVGWLSALEAVTIAAMSSTPPRPRRQALDRPLPRAIAGIPVPHDDASVATWRWAQRSLPAYLFAHSVRAYCWGTAMGDAEQLPFDRRLLWTASLMHDVGLTRIPQNSMCFEVEGSEIARRFLERHGLTAPEADVVAIAIVLHMQPGVT